MKCGDGISSAFITSLPNIPYCSSLATPASSSSTSIWSVASSQSSDDSSLSAPSSDSESCDSLCPSQSCSNKAERYAEQPIKFTSPWTQQPVQCQAEAVPVPLELRRNPRRTSSSSTSRTGCPPALIRQSDRKVNFVDSLVDSSTQIVETIWPLSSVVCRNELGSKGVLPLRTFIQETLRRSRTSYSTLQVALYYLILIKPHVPKHDFTMEQPDDLHANRVLQCGRRMFLAALILASKYLQDRNYSARAWSKISGLNTQEINQNEMAFLIAVNWKLHIAEELFQRWTDIVLKYTPPATPPSPGGLCQRTIDQQTLEWKRVIMRLSPELDNVDAPLPPSPVRTKSRDFASMLSPRSTLPFSYDRTGAFGTDSGDMTPTPRASTTPFILEPNPTIVYTPGRMAPTLGFIPTPRLTPQTSGFSTPAVGASAYLHGKNSMSMALAQASTSGSLQNLDRWTAATVASPQSYIPTRRSSLANSISTASSPESMISDSSRTSRSSSISSASSTLAAAPFIKLDVQARCRSAKLCSEKMGATPGLLRAPPIIASVPEDYEDGSANMGFMASSPESYAGPVGKHLCHLSLNNVAPATARQPSDLDELVLDSMKDAARALQDLHNYRGGDVTLPLPQQPSQQLQPVVTRKRSRPLSIDNSSALHESVRDILNAGLYTSDSSWSAAMVRPPRVTVTATTAPSSSDRSEMAAAARAAAGRSGRKRVCCSTQASESTYRSSLSGNYQGVW